MTGVESHDGMTMSGSTVRVASEHGTVTVFGEAALLTAPPDAEGRMRITLRYASRSLWMWLNKHPDDEYVLDMWAPVPPLEQSKGRLPWMRFTGHRVTFEGNSVNRAIGGYVTRGWAQRDRNGDVVRYRQDVTSPNSEAPPVEVTK